MSKLKAVLFDLDGTLLDTNDYNAEAWVKVLKEFGYTISYDQVRPLIGMGGDNVLPELIGMKKGDPKIKEIGDKRSEMVKTQYIPTAKPFPKATELMRHIEDQGIKLVVATSSSAEEAKILLQKLGYEKLAEGAATSSDAENSKPDPDIVQAALDKGGIAPDEAIMIADSPYDVESAGKAGVKVIALRCGGFSDKDLAGAIAIYDDTADLLAHYDSSPLGPRK